MYNYLQQKRSEAQITKVSNEPDNEVIDIARDFESAPVFPKKEPELYDRIDPWYCFTGSLCSWERIISTIRSLKEKMLKRQQISDHRAYHPQQ